jgi:hypothetical protein
MQFTELELFKNTLSLRNLDLEKWRNKFYESQSFID